MKPASIVLDSLLEVVGVVRIDVPGEVEDQAAGNLVDLLEPDL